MIALALILLAVGAVAGVLAGLLGVGGGIVLVPAFFYVFGALGYAGPELMQLCLGTSLATIVVTSIRSLRGHAAKGAVDWPILRGWAPGIAIGALLGVWVVSGLDTRTLQAVFAALALTIGAYMVAGSGAWRLGGAMPGRALRTALSPVIGLLSVLMGIGGGSFGVPLMTLHGVPIHRAVATASGFGLAISVPSVLGFALVPTDPAPPWTLGAISLPAFALVVVATVLTAPLGVRLAHRTDAGRLKRIFGIFLIAVALNMGWEALA
ncbi:MAG: sulfite exporter TauE/SafE family protein [Paracoccaceae bacterium]